MMRLNFLCCVFLFCMNFELSYAQYEQVEYNPGVRKSYEEHFAQLDARLKKLIDESSDKLKGVAIVSSFKLDTLNPEQARPDTLETKTVSASGYVPERLLLPDMMWGRAKLKKDSLILVFKPWFMQGDEFRNVVTKTNVSSSLALWNNEEKIYELNGSIRSTRFLSVPAKSKITLSDDTYKPGDTIYGLVELESDDYTRLQDAGFVGGKAKLKVAAKYLFKMTVFKDDGY